MQMVKWGVQLLASEPPRDPEYYSPPHLYLVTVESAVATPAGDLLSIGSRRGSGTWR